MESLNMGVILNVVLAGLGLAFVMGAVGMGLWYIKVKPDVDSIKNDLAKKAAAAEVVRINLELDQKRVETQRIHDEISTKQTTLACDLLRKGCQPLFLEKLTVVASDVEEIKIEQKRFSDKIDKVLQASSRYNMRSVFEEDK